MEAHGPEVDLVREFAFPVPFLVICELLGLPDEDRTGLRRSCRPGSTSRTADGGLRGRLRVASLPPRGHRAGSDSTRATVCWATSSATRATTISDVDLAGLADGVFVGGLETSASMLALGTVLLLDRPEHFAAGATTPSGSSRPSRSCCATSASSRSPSPASPGTTSTLGGSGSEGRRRDLPRQPAPDRRRRRPRPRRRLRPGPAPSSPPRLRLRLPPLRGRRAGPPGAPDGAARAGPPVPRPGPRPAPRGPRLPRLSIVYGVDSLPVRLRPARPPDQDGGSGPPL